MRAINRNDLFLVLCAALSLGAGSALADDRPQPGDGHGQTPESAFSACDQLKENDVCELELGDRTIEGTCVPSRDEARLRCQPDHPPRGN